jgi:hypothetical protein
MTRPISSVSTDSKKIEVKGTIAVNIFAIGLCTFALMIKAVRGPAAAIELIPIGVFLLVLILSYCGWRSFLLLTADDVWIDDRYVMVHHRGEWDRFLITNILSVKSRWWRHHEDIVLTLKQDCRFGLRIAFLPTDRRWRRFWRHPIAQELIGLAHPEEPVSSCLRVRP